MGCGLYNFLKPYKLQMQQGAKKVRQLARPSAGQEEACLHKRDSEKNGIGTSNKKIVKAEPTASVKNLLDISSASMRPALITVCISVIEKLGYSSKGSAEYHQSHDFLLLSKRRRFH